MSKLKETYLAKLDLVQDVEFNKDQKELAKKILNKVDDEDLQSVYQLLLRRVKTGFVFDIAPEVNSKQVVLLKKDEKLSFNDNLANVEDQNTLIIGENYDA
ncbi:hypothetical protein, partial [Mycoplasmopsis lipofaciens]|uniref:hypothetical protein n=1 Tax=Mycoplasmopsis lipofaciens TaxID=114884 RepID=UPI000483992D